MISGKLLGLTQEGFHRIAYTEWGQANAKHPPLLCVHGLTRNSRDFDTLAKHFSGLGKHVICPDMPGRGESDWFHDAKYYQYEQYLADLTVVLAQMGGSSVDWIGTSMGGLLGMIMASLPNSPIHRLVINDIGAQIPKSFIKKQRSLAGQEPTFSSIEEAKHYFKKSYASAGPMPDSEWQHLTETSIKQTATGEWILKYDPRIREQTTLITWLITLFRHPLKALGGTLFDIPLWSFWEKITCPVLLIHGEHSDLLTPSIINKMCSIHKNTTVYDIKQAGHAPSLRVPEQINTVYDWLYS